MGDDTSICFGEKITIPGNFKSYLWNDGDTTFYNFVEEEGWYKAIVKNNFGCMSSDSVFLTVAAPPVINLPDTVFLGDLDSFKLDPGDFTSYKWSTGDTTDFLHIKVEGWYSVFVENESGCHSSKSVLVMQQPGMENENSNDWKIINPQPTYLTGLDVYFINERTGFIINNNSLLKTTNAGSSWEKVITLSSANRITFKNSIGYIIGNNGTIYKSTHEGEGWNKLNTNFTDNLNSITLITEDTIKITSSNKLFTSNNGGNTWEMAPISGGIVNDSYFISSSEGHAVCNNGTILKTLDGGESWTKKLSTNTFPSDFFRIVFTNDSVGFATREHNEIFKTTDRGENWQRIKGLDAIYDMHFLDNETGYLSGEHGVMYKTTDGGSNWQYISPTGRIYAYEIYGIFFVNENEGYATGARGRILKTTNGGNTWHEYAPTYIDIKQLDFISDSIAYILVGNEIHKTTDGGKTIINMGAPLPGEKTRQFDFIDDLTGYSISGGETGTSASENSVCKTIDGGKTWTKTHDTYSVMEDIYCMDFINENIGFISGGYNQPNLRKTTDGGKTWITKGESLRFGQIQFLNTHIGYARNAGNYYQRIYKTVDGGENWEIILEKEEGINSLYFIDVSTGFIVGDNGLIYKTVDGGENWEKLTIPYEYYVYVRFISKNIGFILDEEGKLYKTTDGGKNWELWTQIYGISALEIQKGKIYINGTYGKILENSIKIDSVSVHINMADSITNTRALISGTAASNGGTIDSVVFEYSDDGTFSNKIVLDVAINNDSSAFVSTMLSQLKSNTNYLYRLYAVQANKKYYSDIRSFSTLNDYEINLNYVYDYSSDQAKVTGQIISRDTSITDIEFQYSTDNSYENTISAIPNTVLANETSTVEALLTSLKPKTRYYVRLKASYRGQNIYSNTSISFTTTPEYQLSMYSPIVNEKSIKIQGIIRAYKDTITNFIIQFGKSRVYDQKTAIVPDTIYKGEQQFFECQLNDLDSNTVYFYRTCFVMGADTIYGDEHVINLNQDLDIVMLDPEQLSDSSVLVKAIVNSYGKYLYDIKFMYGIGEELTDSIYSYPTYISYKSTTIQATINGLIPNSEYAFKLSTIYNSNRIYSDTTSFFLAGTTGIVKQSRLSDANIYPNPTEQFVTVKCSNPISYIELINLQGIVLIKSDNLELDMSEFPSGVYLVKVFFNKEFITRKIIKK
ncbi:YCF48-related protein [Mariniphaga sediminis]|uniref:YCF48-related protein n=1 Tax=Mariniphaga sediminis TaxID=1628158 RepID=UPI00356723C6